jgi:hypothetical protein
MTAIALIASFLFMIVYSIVAYYTYRTEAKTKNQTVMFKSRAKPKTVFSRQITEQEENQPWVIRETKKGLSPKAIKIPVEVIS